MQNTVIRDTVPVVMASVGWSVEANQQIGLFYSLLNFCDRRIDLSLCFKYVI